MAGWCVTRAFYRLFATGVQYRCLRKRGFRGSGEKNREWSVRPAR